MEDHADFEEGNNGAEDLKLPQFEPQVASSDYPCSDLEGRQRIYVPNVQQEGLPASLQHQLVRARSIRKKVNLNHSVELMASLTLEQAIWLVEPCCDWHTWATTDQIGVTSNIADPFVLRPVAFKNGDATTWVGYNAGYITWAAAKAIMRAKQLGALERWIHTHCLVFEELQIRHGRAEFFIGS